MYFRRQRIKREEAEYAYSGSSSSAYGRGWEGEITNQKKGRTDEEAEAGEEEVYATVREVDMNKTAYVNPALNDDMHATLNRNIDDDIDSAYAQVSENLRSNSFVYNTTCSSSASDVIAVTKDDIAMIEVHQAFSGGLASFGGAMHQHDTDCLRQFGCGSSARQTDHDNPYCKSCEIRPPPRKRDRARNGYDNNVSVRKHLP